MTKTGVDNPNWKGGRVIASTGYVLIRVGTSHPLADVRGYVYEHKLEAVKKYGRMVEPGEIVHHINGNKQDNRHENLEIVKNGILHFVHHRKRDDLRMPDEPNVLIDCKCGCGESFMKYDTSNRPRYYVSGHNSRESHVVSQMDMLLRQSPRGLKRNDILLAMGISKAFYHKTIKKLKERETVFKSGGRWLSKPTGTDNNVHDNKTT